MRPLRSSPWASPRNWRLPCTSSVNVNATRTALRTVHSATLVTGPTSVEPASKSVNLHLTHQTEKIASYSIFRFLCFVLALNEHFRIPTCPSVSGAMKGEWADIANAAVTTWPRRTWTGPAAKTTAPTSAATTENACAAHASARRGTTLRRGTADRTATATTSTVTALETNCVEVSVSVPQSRLYIER